MRPTQSNSGGARLPSAAVRSPASIRMSADTFTQQPGDDAQTTRDPMTMNTQSSPATRFDVFAYFAAIEERRRAAQRYADFSQAYAANRTVALGATR